MGDFFNKAEINSLSSYEIGKLNFGSVVLIKSNRWALFSAKNGGYSPIISYNIQPNDQQSTLKSYP